MDDDAGLRIRIESCDPAAGGFVIAAFGFVDGTAGEADFRCCVSASHLRLLMRCGDVPDAACVGRVFRVGSHGLWEPADEDAPAPHGSGPDERPRVAAEPLGRAPVVGLQQSDGGVDVADDGVGDRPVLVTLVAVGEGPLQRQAAAAAELVGELFAEPDRPA